MLSREASKESKFGDGLIQSVGVGRTAFNLISHVIRHRVVSISAKLGEMPHRQNPPRHQQAVGCVTRFRKSGTKPG